MQKHEKNFREVATDGFAIEWSASWHIVVSVQNDTGMQPDYIPQNADLTKFDQLNGLETS